jgi:hypothetical protein
VLNPGKGTSGKGNKRPVTSDQTRNGDIGPLGRKSGKRASDTIGAKEKAPRGFLGALVGALDYLPLPARAERMRRRVKSKHKPR